MRALWLGVLVACGGGSTPGDDEPMGGPIEVHAELSGSRMPAADIDVIFHDADGEIVLATTTDATGTATIDDEAVAMVSVAYVASGGDRRVQTKTGLRGGEAVGFTLFNPQPNQPPPEFSADVMFTVPANPPGGATQFALDFGCAGTTGASTSLSFTLTNDCRRPGTDQLDAVLLALDGTTLTGYSFMKAVPIVVGGTTVFDFPDGWHNDVLQIVANTSNVPSGVVEARLSLSAAIGGHSFFPFPSAQATVPPPPSRSYTYARGFAETFQHGIELKYADSNGGFPFAFVIDSAPAPPANSVAMFDLGELLPPEVIGISLADATTVRPTIQWMQAGSHEGMSTGFVGFSWTGGSWIVQVPPDDATSVRIPALPTELAEFAPPTDGSAGELFSSFEFYSYAPTYRQALGFYTRPSEQFREVFSQFPGGF